MSAIASLKPGQNIRCTVLKAPKTEDDVQTVLRLMRRDPAIKRGLKKSHRRRMQNLNVYNRGNRDWTSRETVGKIARVVPEATWTMLYTPELAPEFAVVERYLKIQPA